MAENGLRPKMVAAEDVFFRLQENAIVAYNVLH
jgi:hypothetical protein